MYNYVSILKYYSTVCTELELSELGNQLPMKLKVPITPDLMKNIKFEFHVASIKLLNDIMMGLMTVINNMIKVLKKELIEDYGNLEAQTVALFMKKILSLKKESQVLNEIGIEIENTGQMNCLANLPLLNTYTLLRQLFEWVSDGIYDFKNIPFAFKARIKEADSKVLESLPEIWEGTANDLMTEVQVLKDVLKHLEDNLTSIVHEAHVRKMILEYVIDVYKINNIKMILAALLLLLQQSQK